MEIVTMDNEVVKTMMEKIDRIADYVFKKDNVPKEEAEILLTSEEAADLLKISTRTLQRMRKDKTIPYMMARSKCRYRLTDLEECVRRKIVRCNPKTLEEFKHNYLMTRKEADDETHYYADDTKFPVSGRKHKANPCSAIYGHERIDSCAKCGYGRSWRDPHWSALSEQELHSGPRLQLWRKIQHFKPLSEYNPFLVDGNRIYLYPTKG